MSVVVPDWLMATTRVSAMSERRWNPDSSVAGMATTCTRPATSRSSRSARLCPATAAVPCPITATRRIAATREPAANLVRQRGRPELDTQLTVDLSKLAAQRLAERLRRLGDFLQEEVRVRTAVDIAGGDLGDDDVGIGDLELRAVIGDPADA